MNLYNLYNDNNNKKQILDDGCPSWNDHAADVGMFLVAGKWTEEAKWLNQSALYSELHQLNSKMI